MNNHTKFIFASVDDMLTREFVYSKIEMMFPSTDFHRECIFSREFPIMCVKESEKCG